jgi:hypothetical protein
MIVPQGRSRSHANGLILPEAEKLRFFWAQAPLGLTSVIQ